MKEATKQYIDDHFLKLSGYIATLKERVTVLEEANILPDKATPADVKRLLEISVYLEQVWKGQIQTFVRAADYSRNCREIAERIAGENQ